MEYTLPPPWDTAVDGWLQYLTASGHSAATRRTRRGHIRLVARLTATTQPSDVTPAALIDLLAAPTSNEHRRAMRASLRSFYRWAVTNGHADTDHAAHLPTIRQTTPAPRPATDDVWAHIVAHASPDVLLMARLAAEAGLRRSEVAAVHHRDVITDADGHCLIVRGKGNKQRIVALTTSLADAILSRDGDGYLFPGREDGHLSAHWVGKQVAAAMPPGWSMHKLRTRYATLGYAGTRNLRAVQEALGHASVATTQRYTAVTPADVRLVSEAAGRSA